MKPVNPKRRVGSRKIRYVQPDNRSAYKLFACFLTEYRHSFCRGFGSERISDKFLPVDYLAAAFRL
jgi:hypothetical protein